MSEEGEKNVEVEEMVTRISSLVPLVKDLAVVLFVAEKLEIEVSDEEKGNLKAVKRKVMEFLLEDNVALLKDCVIDVYEKLTDVLNPEEDDTHAPTETNTGFISGLRGGYGGGFGLGGGLGGSMPDISNPQGFQPYTYPSFPAPGGPGPNTPGATNRQFLRLKECKISGMIGTKEKMEKNMHDWTLMDYHHKYRMRKDRGMQMEK